MSELSEQQKSTFDMIRRWDAGEGLWTLEMGGLGPGYEQAIQVGMIESLRLLTPETLPTDEKELNEFLDRGVSYYNDNFENGLSGAQAGAIKWLTLNILQRGYEGFIEWARQNCKEKDEGSRMIQISNHWPKAR
jgi:hypothetical protein